MVPPEPMVGVSTQKKQFRHFRNTYNTEAELYEVVMANQRDWDSMAPEVAEWDEKGCDDADVIFLTHGIVSRSAQSAYNQLRDQGKKVGFFRPITLRPFPENQLKNAVKNAERLLIAESAYGQLMKLVQNAIYGSTIKIVPMLRPGVGITSEELIEEYNKL